jgi:hypothetical protein
VGEWAGEQSVEQMDVGNGQREWVDRLVNEWNFFRFNLNLQGFHNGKKNRVILMCCRHSFSAVSFLSSGVVC